MPAHLKGEGLLLNLENGQEWILGRDPELAKFLIEDPAVSRKHARIVKTAEGIFLQNLSDSKSIYINGRELESGNLELIQLREGDQIQIGSHIFEFSEKELPTYQEQKKDTAYDDIFGDLNEPLEPPPPSRVEKEEEPREETAANTKEDSLHESETPSEEHAQDQIDQDSEHESPYDTIFDEEEVEEEVGLPFNLLQPTTLMLKVISGPNAGAEIGIEKGRSYVIGRNPETCGILFHDYSVSHDHAKLDISADGTMEIEDLGSKNGVLVNGQPISGRAAVTPKDVISLGTTVFLIIDREAEQTTIYSSMTPTYEVAKVPEFESPESEEPVAAALPIEEDWKQKPIPLQHLLMAGAFLLTIFIVFMTFFSLFKSDTIKEAHKDASAQIKEALTKYPTVQFSFNPASGKLFLVGHVSSSVDYQEMLFRISELPVIQTTENNVVIDDLVAKSTNDILSNDSAWRSISVRASGTGTFEVTGYVETPAEGVALADFLTVNFPYLDRLENHVIIEDNLRTKIQGLLVTDGFGSVAFTLNGNELVLSGNYSNKMSEEYQQLVKKLTALPEFQKSKIKIQNYAVPSNPSAAGIDLSKNYQVTGNATNDGRGYGVIINQKFYSIHSSIDGMEITDIEPNTILLEKDGIKYKIDYRQ